MMKRMMATILMSVIVLFAGEGQMHTPLSYQKSLTLLQSIQNDAIILGDGKKIVYVFVDPLCPYSRKFITMISKNHAMLSKYRYYIFLYSIPRLKSTDVVSAIYKSSEPANKLIQIMVENKLISEKGDETTDAKVLRIAAIAHKMDVLKRPYLVIRK